jgi:hypothetical protein
VSKNDEFRAFAEKVLDVVDQNGPDAVESLEDERKALVGKIGENILVRGAARFESGNGQAIAAYVHPPANKIGVLVKAEGSPEAARRLAMHIAFAAPRFATRDEVPADEVAKEREIYAKLPEVESKPEQAREKIVEGMLGKRFFAENVLAEQAWIHEPKKTVAQALERRPQQRRAGEAFVQELELDRDDQAAILRELTQPGDLALDRALLALALRGHARVDRRHPHRLPLLLCDPVHARLLAHRGSVGAARAPQPRMPAPAGRRRACRRRTRSQRALPPRRS